jgi:hypothetical protein
MSRTAVRLTLDNLDALPAPCRTCLFWECDAVRRERVEEPATEKEAWVSEVLREWGSCGRVALVDDRLVGYVLYAPASFVPGAAGFPTAPVSMDAVLMTTAYVDPAARGGAVEAFGHRPGRLDRSGREGRCTVPVDFLSGVGFRTRRPHPVTPRMRMDLRTAVSWKSEVEAALERLVGVVRPVAAPRRAPEATPRTGRSGIR